MLCALVAEWIFEKSIKILLFLTYWLKVNFVEFIGATNNELLALKNKEIDVRALYSKIGSDVTDYNRSSVI